MSFSMASRVRPCERLALPRTLSRFDNCRNVETTQITFLRRSPPFPPSTQDGESSSSGQFHVFAIAKTWQMTRCQGLSGAVGMRPSILPMQARKGFTSPLTVFGDALPAYSPPRSDVIVLSLRGASGGADAGQRKGGCQNEGNDEDNYFSDRCNSSQRVLYDRSAGLDAGGR